MKLNNQHNISSRLLALENEYGMTKFLSSVILIIALFLPFTHADTNHSASAGLRWQMTDDTGWHAHYERLGIKGTIEEQTLISFVEVVDGEYLDDSILEVFVTHEGQVTAQRRTANRQRNCLYTGQIKDAPTILDQGWGFRNRTSPVHGSYDCNTDPKNGTWSGTIFW